MSIYTRELPVLRVCGGEVGMGLQTRTTAVTDGWRRTWKTASRWPMLRLRAVGGETEEEWLDRKSVV